MNKLKRQKLKKAYCNEKRRNGFLCLLLVCLVLLTGITAAGCGLDVISVVLDDSVSTGTIPNTDMGFEGCSFNFSTHKLDNANSMGNNFVAYKIYNNKSTLDSEVNALNRLVDDATKKQNSAVSLFNTYYYRNLYIKTGADERESRQFELDNAPHEVRIRLTNYDDSTEDYSAGIWVDNKKKGLPCRSVGAFSFDFGRHEVYDAVPQKDEEDAKNFSETQSEAENGFYYVALFSGFMMLDDDYTQLYSPIHYLGCVKIDSGLEKN